LEATVRFIRESHFEEAGLQEGQNVSFVIQVGIGEASACEKFGFGFGLFGTSAEDFADLLTDLLIDLLTG
jgi:hypothetical protein